MKTLHYAGMDVHKETIDVVVFQEDEREPYLERTIRNEEGVIRKLFMKLMEKGSVVVCYGAGCMGFGLQRMFEKTGVASIVASPGRLTRGGRRNK